MNTQQPSNPTEVVAWAFFRPMPQGPMTADVVWDEAFASAQTPGTQVELRIALQPATGVRKGPPPHPEPQPSISRAHAAQPTAAAQAYRPSVIKRIATLMGWTPSEKIDWCYVVIDPNQPGAACAAWIDNPAWTKETMAWYARKGATVMRVDHGTAKEMLAKFVRPEKDQAAQA